MGKENFLSKLMDETFDLANEKSKKNYYSGYYHPKYQLFIFQIGDQQIEIPANWWVFSKAQQNNEAIVISREQTKDDVIFIDIISKIIGSLYKGFLVKTLDQKIYLIPFQDIEEGKNLLKEIDNSF